MLQSYGVLGLQDVQVSNNEFGCAPTLNSANCAANACFNDAYRTMDGTCNNRGNALFGAAFTPLMRLLPPTYDDGRGAASSKAFPFFLSQKKKNIRKRRKKRAFPAAHGYGMYDNDMQCAIDRQRGRPPASYCPLAAR